MSATNNKIIFTSNTILEALKKMDDESVKSLLVFEDKKFVSLLTIGDIQRAILNNIDLNAAVFSVIDKNKKYANEGEDLETIKSKMYTLRAEFMPVVSNDGELVNVYSWDDLFGSKNAAQRQKLDVPVVIMAGGKGSRLKPLTHVIPKPLIPLNEKTILEIIMDQFIEIGSSKFFISVNYKHEILRYYLENTNTKYNVEYFKEEQPLGTIGSVSMLKGIVNTPFFVTNCDIIIDQDYRDVYDYHIQNKNKITIVSALKSQKIPYGVIKSGEEGLLLELAEKPENSYLINTGVYILNPELIDEIPVNTFFHITELIAKVQEAGGRVGCFPVSEKSWTDIGDWSEYLSYIRK
jgi:dTDP-glucose pyrophosphorylase